MCLSFMYQLNSLMVIRAPKTTIKPDEVIIITLQLLEVKAGGRAYGELPAGVP